MENDATKRRPPRPNGLKPLMPIGGEQAPIGKKRPYDIELEQAVLGALMLEKEALNNVIEIIKPDTFDLEAHQAIYKAIVALFSKSEPIDVLTVTNHLRSSGELELAKGPVYITQLTMRVNSAANIEHYARLLIEYAIKRNMISIANETLRDAYEETTDVFDLLDHMQQSLFEVSEMNIRKNYVSVGGIFGEVLAELEAMRDQPEGLTGVPSGFTALDRITSGWQKSDLIILAARPGMGKTAFVLSAARNAAVEFGKGVAVFSLEMSSAQLVKRLISSEAEIPSDKLRSGKLTDQEWKQLIDKTAKMTQSPLYIDDTPALSILELRAKCRRLKQKNDIQLIIIDYLQLMSGESGKSGNREQEIAHISRSLKQIAKELNVPVIALSQLSRAVETRGGDKKPQLSDLRESGSIEQDADMVIFLYRPEYYEITEDEEGNSVKGMGEVIIAKNRHGALESVNLKYIGKFTKFADLGDGEYGYDEPSGGSGDFFGGGGVVEDFGSQPGATILRSSRMNSDPLSSFESESKSGPSTEDPPF